MGTPMKRDINKLLTDAEAERLAEALKKKRVLVS
jgi:hypothetical protein